MRRLSVRLDDADAERLAGEARRRGLSEAEVVRIAVEQLLVHAATPEPGPSSGLPPAAAASKPSAFGGRVEELGRIRRRPL